MDVPLIWEIFENRYYNLSCNASSYDPTRRITWLMNGVSMQSEAAPGGFTYFPRPEGEEQSVGVDATYQCMVWGVEPGVSLLSQPARYIEKGKYSGKCIEYYRANIQTAVTGYWKVNSHCCSSDYHKYSQTTQQTRQIDPMFEQCWANI